VAVAVSVFEDVRAEHVRRAEFVGSVDLVQRPVETFVVLERGIDIVVATDQPTIVETIAKQRVMITQPLVQRKRIFLVTR